MEAKPQEMKNETAARPEQETVPESVVEAPEQKLAPEKELVKAVKDAEQSGDSVKVAETPAGSASKVAEQNEDSAEMAEQKKDSDSAEAKTSSDADEPLEESKKEESAEEKQKEESAEEEQKEESAKDEQKEESQKEESAKDEQKMEVEKEEAPQESAEAQKMEVENPEPTPETPQEPPVPADKEQKMEEEKKQESPASPEKEKGDELPGEQSQESKDAKRPAPEGSDGPPPKRPRTGMKEPARPTTGMKEPRRPTVSGKAPRKTVSGKSVVSLARKMPRTRASSDDTEEPSPHETAGDRRSRQARRVARARRDQILMEEAGKRREEVNKRGEEWVHSETERMAKEQEALQRATPPAPASSSNDGSGDWAARKLTTGVKARFEDGKGTKIGEGVVVRWKGSGTRLHGYELGPEDSMVMVNTVTTAGRNYRGPDGKTLQEHLEETADQSFRWCLKSANIMKTVDDLPRRIRPKPVTFTPIFTTQKRGYQATIGSVSIRSGPFPGDVLYFWSHEKNMDENEKLWKLPEA